MTKSGFVGVVGEPNAGKSTLINWLVGEKIAMTSKKANATRKRLTVIVMHKDHQIILIDTPGIHEKEKMLNKYMLNEALKVLGDSDLLLYIADSTKDTKGYEKFLALNTKNIPHILVLSKVDMITKDKLAQKIQEYETLPNKSYHEIVPISSTANINKDTLLDTIVKYLPQHPYYFDPELISTENIKDIYKELIREALFEKLNDEIPYESDVIIEKIIEKDDIDKVYAMIITQKNSQKSMIIGKGGKKIKEIGMFARKLLETFSNKKIYLELYVKTIPNWTKNKKMLEEIGYIE
ncbi:MAG: GTPase Era [Epsilonproteobacteria bacterium]|nr:GTPase Era [Campylobacterota bacterium]